MPSVAALPGPPVVVTTAPPRAAPTEAELARERVAKGLRGARARAHLSEDAVVAILTRQGVALNVPMLRRAELGGTITLDLAACLADLYGTTTDSIAGRRLYCRRIALS